MISRNSETNLIFVSTLLFLVSLLSSHFPLIQCVYRFCHNGPHAVYENDCPGGFLAREKLNLTCNYFARTPRASVAQVKLAGDICDNEKTVILDAVLHAEDNMTEYKMESIQQIVYLKSVSELSENDTGGEFIPEDICLNSCLEDWIAPDQVEDEQFIDDGTHPEKASESDILTALQLNKAIFLNVLDSEDEELDVNELNALDAALDAAKITKKIRHYDPFSNDVDDGAFPRVLKLLAKSMRVTVAGCSPFVREEYYRQIFKAFMFLSSKNASVIEDVTQEEYKQINEDLNRCIQKRNLDFYLNGTVCDEEAKVHGTYYYRSRTYERYRRTGYSGRWGRHNPFIEGAWNSIEFAHGYCFETFTGNLNNFHTYVLAMEGLFTSMVLKHWQVPLKLKQDTFWSTALGTADAEQTMKNVDACVIAGYTMSPFIKRLPRPYVTREASENPKPDSAYPVIPLKKGFNGTIEDYWRWYNKQGGFKEISKNFGLCLRSNESSVEMAKAVEDSKLNNCPDKIDEEEVPWKQPGEKKDDEEVENDIDPASDYALPESER